MSEAMPRSGSNLGEGRKFRPAAAAKRVGAGVEGRKSGFTLGGRSEASERVTETEERMPTTMSVAIPETAHDREQLIRALASEGTRYTTHSGGVWEISEVVDKERDGRLRSQVLTRPVDRDTGEYSAKGFFRQNLRKLVESLGKEGYSLVANVSTMEGADGLPEGYELGGELNPYPEPITGPIGSAAITGAITT